MSPDSLFYVSEYATNLNIAQLCIILLLCTFYTNYYAIDTYPKQWWECLVYSKQARIYKSEGAVWGQITSQLCFIICYYNLYKCSLFAVE